MILSNQTEILPQVSVVTPTWNRAEYLKDVWEGLDQQSFRSFEWIVADDGSTDDTIDVVNTLAWLSDFPVTLVNASIRVGKSRIDNEAIRVARGEFVIWCDSDDLLYPEALQTLVDGWNAIPESERSSFAGISALCEADGRILGCDIPGESESDLVFNDLLYQMQSDLVIFTRTELLKQTPFLEVDFLISESSVWNQIGVLKTRFVRAVLEKKRYGEKLCLSKSGKMRYNRGHAYAHAMTWVHSKQRLGFWKRARKATNYLRYAVHGDIGFPETVKLWKRNGGAMFLLLACFPIALVLAVKDRFQGKVEKTHIMFEKSKESAVVKVSMLNRQQEICPKDNRNSENCSV